MQMNAVDESPRDNLVSTRGQKHSSIQKHTWQLFQQVRSSVECVKNINLHNALDHITTLDVIPIKNAPHSQRAFLQGCRGPMKPAGETRLQGIAPPETL